MNDIPCPVCGHSINLHEREGCSKRKPHTDKTPGDYCPCKQSAADIAEYETKQLRERIAILETQLAEAETNERKLYNAASLSE